MDCLFNACGTLQNVRKSTVRVCVASAQPDQTEYTKSKQLKMRTVRRDELRGSKNSGVWFRSPVSAFLHGPSTELSVDPKVPSNPPQKRSQRQFYDANRLPCKVEVVGKSISTS